MMIDLPREGKGCGLLVSGELKDGAKLVKADDMDNLRRHESGGDYSEDNDDGTVRRKKKKGLCRGRAAYILQTVVFLGLLYVIFFRDLNG